MSHFNLGVKSPDSDKITTTSFVSRVFPNTSPGTVWTSRITGCRFESPANLVLRHLAPNVGLASMCG